MSPPTWLDQLVGPALTAAAKRTGEHPFFRALDLPETADGALSRDDFVETQIQFLFAVVFFVTPLRALSARLPPGPAREALLANIHDEEGAGDPQQSHERTFLLLLERLGADREQALSRALWPETRAFDEALRGVALQGEPELGLAVFGMVEALFADLSARLGRGIVRRGYLPAEQLVHYALHETLDHQHAEGFFGPLRALPDTRERRYLLASGLAFGSHLLLRLYDDLYAARARRSLRETRGSHGGGIGLSEV